MCQLSKFYLLIGIFSFVTMGSASSQNITKADYQRASAFTWAELNNKRVFNLELIADFFPDNSGIWFIDHTAQSKTFYACYYNEGKKTLLFDHKRLADSLGSILKNEVDYQNLPFSWIELSTPKNLKVRIGKEHWKINLDTYEINLIDEVDKKGRHLESLSPDGKYLVYKKENNLYLKVKGSGKTDALSQNGSTTLDIGGVYNWGDVTDEATGERPQRLSVSWSPDSKWFQTQICDYSQAEKMYLLDYSQKQAVRPKLLSYFRALPGDTSLAKVIPIFYNLTNPEEPHLSLEPQSYLDQSLFWWLKDEPRVLMVDRERGYKKLKFALIDLDQKSVRHLFTDSSQTRIGRSLGIHLFEGFGKFTFLSERNGKQQIYTYDFQQQSIKNLINRPIIVHSISFTDQQSGWLYFIGSREDDPDSPYNEYLYRVHVEKGGMDLLTKGPGNHYIKFSPDGKYVIDEYSAFDKPATFLLRLAENGDVISVLTRTDTTRLAELSWKVPLGFSCLAGDGKTNIYGTIWRPSHFDPNKKYPVIDQSYSGPNRNVFPNRFVESFYDALYDLAEFGFIVVTIDGRGTAGRDKAFHDFSYKNPGNSLVDHVDAIKKLGKRYKWIDTNRVGIFGHSVGGGDAVKGMLMYPDFYKVAVSSSGNHDYRMSNAWWPEMYVGWPIDSSYIRSSNIERAHKLNGKLLLVHGGLDENLNPSVTFKLAEAFIREDKNFDMMIFPGRNHAFWGYHGAYFRKLRWNYFIEHLLGEKPIWDY